MTQAEHEALTHAAQSLRTVHETRDRNMILNFINRVLDRINRKARGQLTHAEAARKALGLDI